MIRHGENGWLVKRLDHHDLVRGMHTLLQDETLRRRLGAVGRRDAIARYSVERFMTDVLALYRTVLDGRQTTASFSAHVNVNSVARASRP